MTFSIGWFSTGRDEAARELLRVVKEAIDRGEIAGELSFVFSNREPRESPESDLFFELVRGYRLPLVCLSSREFRQGWPGGGEDPQWREGYDREVMTRLDGFPCQVGVLAGYMLIVSPLLCRRYPLLNLHPAAPGGPAGTYQEVIWQLMAARAPASGVMMHLVTPELDKGPPVTYCRYSLRGPRFDPLWRDIAGDSPEEMRSWYGEGHPLFHLIRAQGLKREFPLLVHTLRTLSLKRIKIEDGLVRDGWGVPISGYDLTQEIDRAIARRGHAGK